MTTKSPICIDFETKRIEARPQYPPEPAGVAIRYGGFRRYYGWGHPTENNCRRPEGAAAVRDAYKRGLAEGGLLFQNAKFDLAVMETHFKLKVPSWGSIHDTMFLLFLDDPHQLELGLKPSAQRLLGKVPDEQEKVRDWLLEHQPVPGIKLSKSKSSEHYWGGYISEAPGDLVAEYALGDVDRTVELFELLQPKTRQREMTGAYDRERQLLPILMKVEQAGVPTCPSLASDVERYDVALALLDRWLLKLLRQDINLDSGEELLKAMLKSEMVNAADIPRTPGGKLSFSKDSLAACVKDPLLVGVLRYRAQLKTCLQTFMRPWAETASRNGGLIYTSWNQTKQDGRGDGAIGTRTGRLSSTPSLMNVPKEFTPIFDHELKGLPRLPTALRKLPSLPLIRTYLKPFEDHVLIDRDYSQQEPRILGHFEGGSLMRQYQENPWLDVHDNARDELAKAGRRYERKPVKNTNLGLIYGMGVGKLALKNNMSVEEARELKNAILALYPGLKAMYADMRYRARTNQPIRTWGGREYYCEEPKIVKGRLQEFDYKLVNVLIQGSAADCTKEAIIRFDAARMSQTQLLFNVHDQLTASTPRARWTREMQTMREVMESIEFDVQMLTEGSWSPDNWGSLQDYDKRGERV